MAAPGYRAGRPARTAAGYRVVTDDRRGSGRSDEPSTGVADDTLADDLEAVLVGLDLTDVTLVGGFSMGGGEVVRYLARHGSARVRSAVLASAVPPSLVQLPGTTVPATQVHLVAGGPHGVDANHAAGWNRALVDFLEPDDEEPGRPVRAQAGKPLR